MKHTINLDLLEGYVSDIHRDIYDKFSENFIRNYMEMEYSKVYQEYIETSLIESLEKDVDFLDTLGL